MGYGTREDGRGGYRRRVHLRVLEPPRRTRGGMEFLRQQERAPIRGIVRTTWSVRDCAAWTVLPRRSTQRRPSRLAVRQAVRGPFPRLRLPRRSPRPLCAHRRTTARPVLQGRRADHRRAGRQRIHGVVGTLGDDRRHQPGMGAVRPRRGRLPGTAGGPAGWRKASPRRCSPAPAGSRRSRTT